MSDGADPLASLRRLLDSAAQQPDGGVVVLTDTLVGPARGVLLRRCAVPHEFDIALLQRIGDIDEAEAEACYEQFAELSIIQINDRSLSVHERWRQPLWRWWQEPAQRAEFSALNERLQAAFAALPASATGEDPAARQRLFHLLGCRPAAGMDLFETQFRAARHRRRFSECRVLLQLAHEHDPSLSAADRARIAYQDGKLASDLRRWDEALGLLREVSDNAAAPPRLRSHAAVRVGHALRQLGRTEDALALLEPLHRAIAADPATAGSAWRALYELGETYRDLGRADDAVRTLGEALATMRDDDEDADRPGVLNALGTAQLKLRDTEAAVASFESSLQRLRLDGDALRGAGVLNNLALAQLERCDWKAAETSLLASLESKRAVGDLSGQATALFNLARARSAQKREVEALGAAEQSQALYRVLGDARGLARARLAVARLLRATGRRADAAALLATLVADARAAGDTSAVEAAEAELEQCAGRGGMPMWGWILIGLAMLIVAWSIVAS